MTEVWSRRTFREHVDYGRKIRFLSPEEWEKREPPYRGTGPKLAPVQALIADLLIDLRMQTLTSMAKIAVEQSFVLGHWGGT